jgi:hypothetical protein
MSAAEPRAGSTLSRFLSLEPLDNRYPALHGLRVLAIISVVQFHVTWIFLEQSLKQDNELAIMSLTVFFVAVAVRFFPRTSKDPTLTMRRLEPGSLAKGLLRFAPFLLVPVVLGTALGLKVHQGYQGGAAKEKAKDYWRQNLATWKDAPLPDLTAVDLKLDLEPRKSALRTEGTYRLVNRHAAPMAQVALTGDLHWKNVKWTLDGKECKPESRTGLYVFTPPAPIARDQGITVGFSFDGVFPDGISRNGARTMEFILPSGAVLTSFSPSFAPVVGYLEERLKKYRYAAIGEFHLYGADADLPVPRRMVELAKQHGLILHAHSDVVAVERLFRHWPEARILWAHSGFARADEVRDMLKKHKNLWSDLALRGDHHSGGKVTDEWRAAFLEFPDRFALGTDTFTPERWLYVGEHANTARVWLSTLPKDVAEKIAYRNAEALLGNFNTATFGAR